VHSCRQFLDRALAPEVMFPSPQRLKPSHFRILTAPLKGCSTLYTKCENALKPIFEIERFSAGLKSSFPLLKQGAPTKSVVQSFQQPLKPCPFKALRSSGSASFVRPELTSAAWLLAR
jgi:hypothetical protein